MEIKILSTSGWDEYELLDSGEGCRLERVGKCILVRPDPQCMWNRRLNEEQWDKADAVFAKSADGREQWVLKRKISEKWLIKYKELSFYVKLTPFKHLGVFAEQHLMWDWMENKIKDQRSRIKATNKILKILNLFAYTGMATLVAAKAGCEVTHVDASSSAIGWARENQTVSNLLDKPIRWIKDDVLKFCERELRRGNKYDGIIMDPPVYGHGPNGEVWDFNKSFPKLLSVCRQLLSENPLFVVINAYAVSASSIMLENVLADYTEGLKGNIEAGELCLEEKASKRLLSTGIFARWSR